MSFDDHGSMTRLVGGSFDLVEKDGLTHSSQAR
jgi:hypothetical protein